MVRTSRKCLISQWLDRAIESTSASCRRICRVRNKSTRTRWGICPKQRTDLQVRVECFQPLPGEGALDAGVHASTREILGGFVERIDGFVEKLQRTAGFDELGERVNALRDRLTLGRREQLRAVGGKRRFRGVDEAPSFDLRFSQHARV